MTTRRTDGRLQKNIFVGEDNNGNRKFKTIYANSTPELERKSAEVLENVRKGIFADDKKMTLKKYADTWIDTYKNDVAPSTRHGYANILKNHLGKCADVRLKELTKTDLQKQMNTICGYELKRRFKLTVNQILTAAIDDGLVYRNVCTSLELPPKIRKEKRALTDIEKKAILKCNLSIKENAFVSILLYTGMRRGEVLALTKTDIDFKNGSISVNKSLGYVKNQPDVRMTKTLSGVREIPISGPLNSVLKEYLPTLQSLSIFPNKSGQYMSDTSFKRFWDILYRKLNVCAGGKYIVKDCKLVWQINPLKGLTPHIFRHNYATILYYAGVDLKDAVRLLGHADCKTTLDIYTHLNVDKSKSKDKIEEYLNCGNL